MAVEPSRAKDEASAWCATERSAHLRGRVKVGTRPEVLLRQALHRRGLRFRLQRRIARGCTADVVLPRFRLAVFVDGDFWHGCPIHGRRHPFTGPNSALWTEKIARTKQRDVQATYTAQGAGWRVVRVWECEVYASPSAAAAFVEDAARKVSVVHDECP